MRFRYAGNLLLRETSYSRNDYFVYNVLFLGLIFAPSGMYLLWQFPGTLRPTRSHRRGRY